MIKERMEKARQHISAFINRHRMYELMTVFMAVMSKRKDVKKIKLSVNPIGQSYISAKFEMNLACVPDIAGANPEMSDEHLKAIYRGLAAHELAHFDETSFKAFIGFVEAEAEEVTNAKGRKIKKLKFAQLRKHIINVLEDGRIERKKGEFNNKLQKYFDFLNLSIIESSRIMKKLTKQEGSSIIPEVEELLKNTTEPRDKKYLEDLLKEMKKKETDEERSDFQDFMSAVWTISKIEAYPHDYDLFSDLAKEKIEEGLPFITQAIYAKNTAKACIGAEEIVRIAKELMKEEEKEEQENQESSNEDNEFPDMGDEQDQQDGEGEEKESEGSEGEPSQKTIQPKKYQEAQKKQEGLKRMVETLEKEDKKTKEKELTQQEVTKIETQYRGDKYVEKRPKSKTYNPAGEVLQRGKNLKKEIEKILKSNQKYTLYGQRRGLLNASELHKVAGYDFQVFKKIGNPETINAVAYELKDGSGSMSSHTKAKYASEASAVIEEAFKELMPLKSVVFHTMGKEIQHEVVKNFDEKPKENVSWSFSETFGYNGCNKDGFSIRIATQELAKRPEKDKLLIVLSDGLPSDYNSTQEAIADVRRAVNEAKKLGIYVFAIFFGSEQERKSLKGQYEQMYGRNIVMCDPRNIEREYTELMKRFLKK